MAQFSVKTGQAKVQIDEEIHMAKELQGYEDSVRSIANHLSFKIASAANIRARLQSAAGRIDAHQAGMNRMHSALQNIMNDYERTEQRIYTNAGGKGDNRNYSLTERIYELFQGNEKALEEIKKVVLSVIDAGSSPEGVIKRLEELAEYVEKTAKLSNSEIGLLLTVPELIKGGQDIIDIVDKQLNEIKDTIIDKTGFDESVKVESALFKKELNCENGSLGVSAGAYEAYASAKGGLFTKSDDGELLFNPNIDAEMGASFTALEAVGAYAIGNQMLGADVNGHMTVGKVAAEAEAQASLYNSDGSFNPHAKLDAKAEAILIDAKAQAGVTVLGTRADVTGSVNIGVGAHANVEVGDGVISCDIGASLGIGASVSFTIDYGGTVDAVQKAAKSAWKDVKDAAKKFLW